MNIFYNTILVLVQARIIAQIVITSLDSAQWDLPGLILISCAVGFALFTIEFIFYSIRDELKQSFHDLKYWWRYSDVNTLYANYKGLMMGITFTIGSFFFGCLFVLICGTLEVSPFANIGGFLLAVLPLGFCVMFVVIVVVTTIYYKGKHIKSDFIKYVTIFKHYNTIRKGFDNKNMEISYFLNREERGY